MAKFAIVAPINIVEQLDRLDALGPTHLLLAHDVVLPQNRERYYGLFHPEGRKATGRRPLTVDRQDRQRETLIIMDNSVIETGQSASPAVLKDACDLVAATCVVLPDVLEDSAATTESCLQALKTWHQYVFPSYMMVPQGRTLADFTECAENFVGISRIKYWGVPRNLVKLHGSRLNAIITLFRLDPSKHIHLMGFSDNLEDDIRCAKLSMVGSIDSAVPLRLEKVASAFEPSSISHEPRGDWWHNAKFHAVTPRNLSHFRSLVRGP